MDANAEHCAALVRERDPDRYLATLYAPAARRAALFAVHAFDLELLALVETTSDAMIGQIRLAWWRERLADLADGRAAPGQPVLAALAGAPRTALIALAGLDDAYAALLDGDAAEWAVLRGLAVFAAAAAILGGDDPRLNAAGCAWAVSDARRRGHESAATPEVPRGRVASAQRPVFALAALARRDRARPVQPAGVGVAPSRQLALLAFMLTGRL